VRRIRSITRILGLPIQASEQLQQAYRDRTLQLPRREYSETAIMARKQLLEAAYGVLSVEQRTCYDASYFAYTYERGDANNPQSYSRSSQAKALQNPLIH